MRTGSPIFATEESLLDEAGLVAADELADEEPEDEAILDEFRDFLDDINPEDFDAADHAGTRVDRGACLTCGVAGVACSPYIAVVTPVSS